MRNHYKTNSFACSLANRDKPVAATLQGKCSGGKNCSKYRDCYKKMFQGIILYGTVPGLSRDCPGILPAFSWDFLGILFMCFPFSCGERETHKQFDPPPFPDNPAKLFIFIGFFSPWIFYLKIRSEKLKNHSLGHSEPGAQKSSKSTSGGTFRRRPLSTPANGGWILPLESQCNPKKMDFSKKTPSPKDPFSKLDIQEWPRQTKPKKGQFMNFSQGHSGTKVQCESCLFSLRKNKRIHKMGEIHELFVLALSLVWFAGATPDKNYCRIRNYYLIILKRALFPGETKLSTSTVAALFSKMALTGQGIAMVDMAFLVFTAFPHLP